MTVKELINELNPHFCDCEIYYLYLEEELTHFNIQEYENELVENYSIEPISKFEIAVRIW